MKLKTSCFLFLSLFLFAVNSQAEGVPLSFQKLGPREVTVMNERTLCLPGYNHKARLLKFLPKHDKLYQCIDEDEELRVCSGGLGYAMLFEEEDFALRRAADDAFSRAVKYVDFPLDDLLAELAGGQKKYLHEPFYGEYLKTWKAAFVYEYKKRPSAVVEWVRTLGYRMRQGMCLSFVPVGKKDSSFKIKQAKLTKSKYETGELLNGSFKVSHDCYVTVLRASENGTAEILFPFAGEDGFVKRGETVHFSSEANFTDDETGKGLVHIIAVKEVPLQMTADPLADSEKTDSDSDDEDEPINFAESYARGLRDFTRKGWTSAIIPYEVKQYRPDR